MSGYKTVIFNGLIAMVVALLTYVVGVDWQQYVSESTAIIILAVANLGLRIFTTTPIFNKSE